MPQDRVTLANPIESRTADTSKDSRSVNCIFETKGDHKQLVKRPGIVPITATVSAGQGQGMFSWNSYLISCVNKVLYLITGQTSSSTLGTLNGNLLPLSFCSVAGDTKLAFHDGSNLYTVNAGTPPTFIGGVGLSGVTASATINNAGGYYPTASVPAVTFSASPTTDTTTGTAVLFNNQVASITITHAGSGYTSAPSITIAAPPAGSTATMHVTLIGSTFTYIIDSGGSGYLTPPNIYAQTTFTYPTLGPKRLMGVGSVNTSGVVTGFVSNGSPGYGLFDYYTIDPPTTSTATATAVMASAGITGPFAPGIVYLDNKVYVAGKDGNVYDSATDNPASWAGTSLRAGSDPDGCTGIVRHLNYILVFGDYSTECFYDAGNGTGSPLAVAQTYKTEIGCSNGYSIASAEMTVIWMGQSLTGGRSIYLMDGMSPTKVSTRYIDKYLNAATITPLATGASSVRASCIKLSGHTLYILTLINSNLTLVYDLDEKEWYQWTSQSGGSETFFNTIAFDSNLEYQSGLFLQGNSDGKIYKMDPTYTTDNGESIYYRAVTPSIDNGSNKRKFYPRIELIGDKVSATAQIRHSDDDYQTWSNYRSVDMSNKRPVLYQNGSARRRAWEVLVTDNVAVRLDALEVDIDIGELGNN